MFKKTLGIIALLLLIIVGEGYWLSQSDIRGKWTALIQNQLANSDFSPVEPLEGDEEPVSVTVATLGDATGSVTVTRDGEALALSPFMTLMVGDRIETGADGRAEIGWTGYGRTLIASNTKLTITVAEHGDSDDGIMAKMKLESGRIWTRLERLLSSGSSFEVKASNVVATVRGTSFGIGLDQPGRVEIKVAESHVAVSRTTTADSDEVVGSPIIMDPMQRMDMAEKEMSLPKPIAMTKGEIEKDLFLMEGNIKVPQEYLDMEWMAFVEMILSQIPADQMPADFDRAAFMEYMRQVQAQIPDEVKQQYMQEFNAGTY
ncbi:FecR family protein [Candidatus Uhrbacteria bacterium]|nr:FecR family protein [Candidatus Uhrbacteria bacterium]